MKKTVIMSLIAFMALSSASLAADHVNNVQFSSKMPSLSTKGAVVRGDRDVYLLNAGKGSIMTVTLKTAEHNGCLEVTMLSGDAVGGQVEECDGGFSWVSELQKAGAYSIAVSPTRGNVTYQLEVSVSE